MAAVSVSVERIVIIFQILKHITGHEITDLQEDLQNNLHRIIPQNYLKHTLPPIKNGNPLNVNFNMRVYIISSVNFDDMDFSVNMYLKQEWQDSRLTVPKNIFLHDDDQVELPYQIFDNLWKPDLFFLNTKIEETNRKYSTVTLFKNKTLRMITNVHTVVACQMEFSYYPMDTQFCPIAVESFSYNNKKITLTWNGVGVTMDINQKHPQYDINPIFSNNISVNRPEKNGNFSRLVVCLAFERQIGHAVIQIFAPSTLIVVLSWFSFWLDFDAIPGRVTLLVTCLLSLVTMYTDLRVETPVVHYVKALDIWIAGCLFSVFGAVAEFVIAKVLFVKYNELKKNETVIQNNRGSTSSEFADPNSQQYIHNFQYKGFSEDKRSVKVYWITSKGKERILWKELDKVSRAIFPLFFFAFSVIYWTMMIYGTENHRQSVQKNLNPE